MTINSKFNFPHRILFEKLFHRRLIKTAVEILCLNHIHNHMGICFPHEMDNVIDLIGRNHRMKKIHAFMAVTSHCIHIRNAVPVLFNIFLNDLLCPGSGYLKCHPLIPVVEGRYGFR